MSQQAEDEVNEIISTVLDEGIHPMAAILLSDVRKLMVLSWKRGYSVALEESNNRLAAAIDAAKGK